MDTRLIQQQSQKLILSPQIRQYLRLLQMPMTELSQAVETEMTENPLLEETPSSPPDDPADPDPSRVTSETDTRELRPGETFEHLDPWQDNLDSFDSSGREYSRSNSRDLQRMKNFQEASLTKPETLSDYLLWQIRFLGLSKEQIRIAEEIIGDIDDHGYLQSDVASMAESLSSTPEEVEQVLKHVHSLEPPGIGARNLQEAMLLQLARKGLGGSLAYRIVAEHLPLLEKRDLNQLARIYSTDLERVKQALSQIMLLEPRPGRSFYAGDPITVVPDAVVSFDGPEDTLKIEILNERVPGIRISAYYRRLLRSEKTDPATKAFLREKLQAATAFLQALDQRGSTLRLITEQIAKEQRDFFTKGFSHLKPLRLKDIADSLGIHESTVSLALSNKYIQTPMGTIPYKSFFSSKLETVDGEAESQKSILEKIRMLVESENRRRPLSDQAIVRHLQNDGIMIARRTVAKYRDLLKILPSHLRRQR